MIIMSASEPATVICIVVGFIPYLVKRQRAKGGHVLEVRALFWSVQYTSRQWTIRVPLIERLRNTIWTVIMHLRKDDPSQQ